MKVSYSSHRSSVSWLTAVRLRRHSWVFGSRKVSSMLRVDSPRAYFSNTSRFRASVFWRRNGNNVE